MRGRALGLPHTPSDGIPWDQGPRGENGWDPRSPGLVRALEKNRDVLAQLADEQHAADPRVCRRCAGAVVDMGYGLIWCEDCNVGWVEDDEDEPADDESLTLFE